MTVMMETRTKLIDELADFQATDKDGHWRKALRHLSRIDTLLTDAVGTNRACAVLDMYFDEYTNSDMSPTEIVDALIDKC